MTRVQKNKGGGGEIRNIIGEMPLLYTIIAAAAVE